MIAKWQKAEGFLPFCCTTLVLNNKIDNLVAGSL